jgi:hypothetical protein
MFSKLAAAGLATSLCFAALAAGRTLSAPDLDTYTRLRDARALADQRQEGPGGKAARAQADADFKNALQAARWTAQRYEEVDALVGDVTGYLQNAEEDPKQAEGYWDGVDRVDAATVAMVKARLPHLSGATDRARQALRLEQEVAVLGRLASKADVQGTWRRDPAASRAHLASAMRLDEAQVRDIMKDQGESTFAFSGDQVEGREVRGGTPTTWKTSYRIDGRNIVFNVKGREEKLQIGVKSPTELIFGMMGVPSSVYRKQ